MDCACCGLAIEVPWLVAEDDEFTCTGCGATCVVFSEDDGSAYFGSWTCKHGVSGDKPCDQCEIEHGVTV